MGCETRIKLLNSLSRAVVAYNEAVIRMVHRSGSLSSALQEQVLQAREACNACRAALFEHERDHGCSTLFAALQNTADGLGEAMRL